ncbi:hypothetical protein CR513_62331, partial [Mucuna pruriens]
AFIVAFVSIPTTFIVANPALAFIAANWSSTPSSHPPTIDSIWIPTLVHNALKRRTRPRRLLRAKGQESSGILDRYKARLFAKEYTQTMGSTMRRLLPPIA